MQHSMKQFITIKQQARTLLYLFTPCMECCGHAEIVLRIPINREEKESPWRSR